MGEDRSEVGVELGERPGEGRRPPRVGRCGAMPSVVGKADRERAGERGLEVRLQYRDERDCAQGVDRRAFDAGRADRRGIVHVDHDRLGQDRSKVGFEITEERGQTSGPRWVVGCRVGNV